LQDSEFLVNTAQVAIGLAGFSGVAGVLGARPGSASPEFQGARLRLMIETSLLAAGFSLLPIVLEHLGFEPRTLWRVASGMNLLAFAPQFTLALRRSTAIIRASGEPTPRAWGAVTTLIAMLTVALLAASALGFGSSSLYIAAIFLQLVLAGIAFHRFFAALAG
jgi:hypothetical protein